MSELTGRADFIQPSNQPSIADRFKEATRDWFFISEQMFTSRTRI